MIDALTLDQLRMLVTVAEAGSFSAAARRLGRVQSAVSQSMQTLEGMLGVTLFDRAGKLPVLTEAGRAMVDEGRLVIDRVSALRAHARAMAEGTEPELSLALDPLFPTDLMMQSLRALQASFPRLPVALFTEGLGAPEQRLRDRVVRFAIYSPLATPGGSDLETAFLTNIAMVPVVAADHPLAAAAEPIGRDVLDGEIQLVLTDRSPLSQNQRGGIYSSRIWRFAD